VNRIFQYISYHLLPSITIAFTLGIASIAFFHSLSFSPSFVTIILPVLAVIITILHYLKWRKSVFFLLLFLFWGIGVYHTQTQSYPPEGKNHIWNIIVEKQEAVIIGTVFSIPKYNGEISQIEISTNFLRLRNWDKLTPVQGNILLRMKGPWPDQFRPGDTLAIRTDLKRPSSFHSPGSFDFSQYLARKNIWITGFIRTPLFLKQITENHSLIHKLRYFPERVRFAIGREIDNRVAPELSGLYRAILIGDKSRVDETVLEQFKASGVMHILAISGIHMSIIAALLFWVFFKISSLSETMLLKFNIKKLALLLCLPVLIFYSMLAGLNVPVIRSVIMSGVIIGGICINRKKSPIELFSFAVLLILTISPLQLFTASFQLSFTAVAAIIFILPVLKQLLIGTTKECVEQTLVRKAKNWLVAGLLVSTVATLATLPLSLYYFNRFSLIGPVANLVLESLICIWSLSWGIIAIPFLFFLPKAGGFFLMLGSYGLELSLQFVQFFSSFSWSNFRLPTPSPWLIFFYYLLPVLLMFQMKYKNLMLFSGFFLFCGTAALFIYNPQLVAPTHPQSFLISFLDVGQGSSTLLEFPSGYRVLIDGGGSSFSTTTVGERVIAPYLWKKGISRIDAIIVTHPDADHYNGLTFIVDHFSPSIVWLNSFFGHDAFYKQFQKRLEEKKIPFDVAVEGWGLRDHSGKMRFIANTTKWSTPEHSRNNRHGANSGLVVQACSNNFCILLPGDISRQIEQLLVEKKYDLRSNLLLSAHHGSATSNSKHFIEAVNPEYMIVSAGKSNKNTFPSPGLVHLCTLNNIKLLQTARHGTIEIISKPESNEIYGYRKSKKNPLLNLERYSITKTKYN